MTKRSVIDRALEVLDAKIAGLQLAKEALMSQQEERRPPKAVKPAPVTKAS